ncbi:MAG TPA: alkaline phosphatase family protein [Candidatus Angelobacter sp.]|jgi:phospholipase C|nr:alkaline phosphatase family protein [Candidatus Angelobacter sp.]
MKLASTKLTILPVILGVIFAQAQTAPPPSAFPSAINHVIVVFQENRTPDNLFQGLFGLTGANGIPYNIQNFYTDPSGVQHALRPVGMAANFDLDHSDATNPNSGFQFENTHPGVPVSPSCGPDIFGCATSPTDPVSPTNQFMFVDNSISYHYNNAYGQGTTHVLDPYLAFAKQYGWANHMFQTNQGPSYPAHQFIFGGTSGDTDSSATFVSENFGRGTAAGCLAPSNATNFTVSPVSNGSCPAGCTCFDNGLAAECPTPQGFSFCYNHATMATMLDFPPPPKQKISWKYYAPSAGSIWTAPNSIAAICSPSGGQCMGQEWQTNVDLNPTDILKDINNCQLPQVSWAIPDGRWSDHANVDHGLGSSWVAAIINAIGGFQNNCGYWNNTAIVVTWDDWGGWFDHETPFQLTLNPPCQTPATNCQGDYQYGFRVPLMVVSAYTPSGYVNDIKPHDFGSILRMIQGIFGLQEGGLGFADARATTDLRAFFSLTQPRAYTVVPAIKDATFFLSLAGPPVAPDND